jgi:hypothetical protein
MLGFLTAPPRSSLDFLTVGTKQVSTAQATAKVNERDIQNQMDSVYRAARAIQGATRVGVTEAAFTELENKLSTELLLVSDKARANSVIGPSLQPHIDRYGKILALYVLSDKLWAFNSRRNEVLKYCQTGGDSLPEINSRYDHCLEEANVGAAALTTALSDAGMSRGASLQNIWALAAKFQEDAAGDLLGFHSAEKIEAIKPDPKPRLPEWVPRSPGSTWQPTSVVNLAGTTIFGSKTDDSPAKVLQYFEQALHDAGFQSKADDFPANELQYYEQAVHHAGFQSSVTGIRDGQTITARANQRKIRVLVVPVTAPALSSGKAGILISTVENIGENIDIDLFLDPCGRCSGAVR